MSEEKIKDIVYVCADCNRNTRDDSLVMFHYCVSCLKKLLKRAKQEGIIKKTENKFKKMIKENINDLDQVKKDFVKNDNETVWVGETETLFDRLSFLQKKYGKQIKEVQKE